MLYIVLKNTINSITKYKSLHDLILNLYTFDNDTIILYDENKVLKRKEVQHIINKFNKKIKKIKPKMVIIINNKSKSKKMNKICNNYK